MMERLSWSLNLDKLIDLLEKEKKDLEKTQERERTARAFQRGRIHQLKRDLARVRRLKLI